MGFCNFSQELVNVGYTTVDNLFITNYLPEAPNKYVDIYLFGLYLLCYSLSLDGGCV